MAAMSFESIRAEIVVVDGRQSPTALSVARGTSRLMRALGFSCISEMPLASGRRADLVALGADSELVFFATAPHVPLEIFPEDAGLILADGFGAEVIREAPVHKLSPATRRSMLLRYARIAALRLQTFADPSAAALGAEF
jgi:hypothetical protein